MERLHPTVSGDTTKSFLALFTYTGAGASQRYRCVHPAQQLVLHGCRCALSPVTSPTLGKEAARSDILVLHRVPAGRHIESVIRRARNNGSIVLFDIDDLLFDPSLLALLGGLSSATLVERILRRDEMEQFARTIQLSDGCIVSTDYLAARVRAFGHQAWVVRNAFSLEMLSISEQTRAARPARSQNFVVGYASGTRTHNRDFEEAAPALREFLSLHREAELWIVGHLHLSSDWDSFGARIRRIPFVPWQELPGILARFDVNIVPLESGNPFCQAKSEIKWMEAALVEVPTIAAQTDAFEHAIDHGKTGLLAASLEDWYGHLAALAQDEAQRCEMGAQAREAALLHYHPIVRGGELIRTLDDVSKSVHGHPLWLEGDRSMKAQPRIPSAYDIERLQHQPSLLRKALYSLRNRGLLFLFLQSLFFIVRHRPWRRPS